MPRANLMICFEAVRRSKTFPAALYSPYLQKSMGKNIEPCLLVVIAPDILNTRHTIQIHLI